MAVAAILAGCLGADDEPQPATGAARAVGEVVERLERATVRTHATGQAEVDDVLLLRRRRGEWRIDALGG